MNIKTVWMLAGIIFSATFSACAANENVLLMDFNAVQARGPTLKVEKQISHWSQANEYISWTLEVPRAGTYWVGGDFAGKGGVLQISIVDSDQTVEVSCPKTGGWGADTSVSSFAEKPLKFKKAGRYTLELKPADPEGWKPVNVYAFGLVEGTKIPETPFLAIVQKKHDDVEWAFKKSNPMVYSKYDFRILNSASAME